MKKYKNTPLLSDAPVEGGTIDPIIVPAKRDNVYIHNPAKPVTKIDDKFMLLDDYDENTDKTNESERDQNVLNYYLNIWAPLYAKRNNRSVGAVRGDVRDKWNHTLIYTDPVTSKLRDFGAYNVPGTGLIGMNPLVTGATTLAHEFSHALSTSLKHDLKLSEEDKKILLDAYHSDLTIPKVYGWRSIFLNDKKLGIEEARATNNAERYRHYTDYRESDYPGTFDEYIDNLSSDDVIGHRGYFGHAYDVMDDYFKRRDFSKYPHTTVKGISILDSDDKEDKVIVKSPKELVEEFIRKNNLNPYRFRDKKKIREYVEYIKNGVWNNYLFNSENDRAKKIKYSLKHIAQNNHPYENKNRVIV